MCMSEVGGRVRVLLRSTTSAVSARRQEIMQVEIGLLLGALLEVAWCNVCDYWTLRKKTNLQIEWSL